MTMIEKVRSLLVRHFYEMKWHTILLSLLIYLVVSWILLWLCGEWEIVGNVDYFYWIVVTASTVGYGDLSPVSLSGRMVTSLFVIPVGLGIFGLTIGRVAAYVSHQWRKGMKGLKALDYHDHVLVIGWHSDRTIRLLKLLLREIDTHADAKHLALCVRA
uniref:potassium channel family protein n=1 Tax=Halomonas sp. TaxID=1486246 RepID=UPI002615D86E|nr:potassium channel family protein [Halomonas sp.]